MKLAFFALAVAMGLSACTSSVGPLKTTPNSGLRLMTANERSQDFETLLELFQEDYGPYKYKEANLKIDIASTLAALKAESLTAKTDEEFAGDVMRFGASLKDGHVQISIEYTATGVQSYGIPLVVTPVEHRAIVADVDPKLAAYAGIGIGDEILAVDGQPTMSYLPKIVKYKSWARDESNEHLIYYVFARPTYMTDILPSSTLVEIKVQRVSGELKTVSVPWIQKTFNNEGHSTPKTNLGIYDMRVDSEDFNNVLDGNIKMMGSVKPFFLTPQTQSTFNFVQVSASDEFRKRFGLKDEEKPEIYAALYRSQGKTVLLVRQATYSPDDFSTEVYMKAYQALLAQYHDLADVLVLDQTHNPGGSYCADFYDLFAHDGDVQSVELLHADRKWIDDLKVNWMKEDPKLAGTWDAVAATAAGHDVEAAYDAGQDFSSPTPLFQGSFFTKKRDFRWDDKPALILIDELAGSCGDMFPMLVKANGHIKLFGANTMGLGGNVEEVGVLGNSRIHVKLTRGMFYAYNPNRSPLATEFVENNGVAPDIAYTHTVKDLRKGYVDYVNAFTAEALKQ